MKTSPFIYIISDGSLYGSGMVFDSNGNFCYAINSEDIPYFIKSNSTEYLVIDPKEKTVFNDKEEDESIETIGRYFNNVFKENSPLIDSKQYFSKVFSKIINEYSFVGKNVFDYGSGNRKYSSFFKDSNYIGHDINISDYNIEQLTKYEFDYVLCNFVLEHVANPYNVLNNAISYLKKGGILIASIPALTFFEFVKYYLLRIKLHLPLFHFRTFSIVNFKGCMSFIKIEHFLNNNKIRIQKTISVNSFSSNTFLSTIKPLCYFGKQIIIIGEKY